MNQVMINGALRDPVRMMILREAALYWRLAALNRDWRRFVTSIMSVREAFRYYQRFVHEWVRDDVHASHQLPNGRCHGHNTRASSCYLIHNMTGERHLDSLYLITAFHVAGKMLTQVIHSVSGAQTYSVPRKSIDTDPHIVPNRVVRLTTIYVDNETQGADGEWCTTRGYSLRFHDQDWALMANIGDVLVTEVERPGGYALYVANSHLFNYKQSWFYQLRREPELIKTLRDLPPTDAPPTICTARGWRRPPPEDE